MSLLVPALAVLGSFAVVYGVVTALYDSGYRDGYNKAREQDGH
jgi:hypothetical protein